MTQWKTGSFTTSPMARGNYRTSAVRGTSNTIRRTAAGRNEDRGELSRLVKDFGPQGRWLWDGSQFWQDEGGFRADGVTAPPLIFNNVNTFVSDVGDNSWRIEKVSGGAGAYDADAISSVGFAGDFVLRVTPIAYTNAYTVGMNTDPLTDSNYTSVDYGLFNLGNEWYAMESGVNNGGPFAFSTYGWIWRSGTDLKYGVGATFAAAAASPLRTVAGVTATLYFDTSFAGLNSIVEAYLSPDLPSAPTIYTLTANLATYAMTGNSANLNAQRRLTANLGTFALTGQSAGLKAARRLTANLGTYAMTGQTAALSATRRLTANAGSFTMTGQDAALSRAVRLTANAGSFTMNGQSAILRANRLLTANAASFAMTGLDAAFTRAIQWVWNSGTYAMTGQSADLEAIRRLALTPGSYALSGQSADLEKLYRLVLSTGSFVLTGNSAILAYSGAGGGGTASVRVTAMFMRP